MAGSINRVSLLGHLGRDPEIRKTQDGKEISNLSLATTESWKDRSSGERREKTEWHRVVIFNDALVGVARDYLRKGSRVFLEGNLQTRKWTDQTGVEKYATEIVLQGFNGNLVLLDQKREDGSVERQPQSTATSKAASAPPLDDEIPF